jgi:nucleotide-binding universal stress UspA family protein
VGWTFRVARGGVTRELLHAAGSADLLVLGRTGRGLAAGAGATARSAAARATAPVLLHPAGAMAASLLVACDGSRAAERALDVARVLAAPNEALELLVAAPSVAEADEVARRARERLGRADAAARWVGGAERRHLVRALRGVRAMVVVPASPMLGEDGPGRLVDEVAAPLLIVR